MHPYFKYDQVIKAITIKEKNIRLHVSHRSILDIRVLVIFAIVKLSRLATSHRMQQIMRLNFIFTGVKIILTCDQ